MLSSSPTINENAHSNLPTSSNIPEFVKKLFGMLEDNTYPQVFSWGMEGDTFVVKDPNEFARHILPKHFKHSNFASFVRQLNKYDFHKLRLPEDGQRIYGDQAWEFQHPNFKYNRRELLEEIKRKPTGKSAQAASSAQAQTAAPATNPSASTSASTIMTGHPRSTLVGAGATEELKALTNTLQKEINSLKDTQKKMTDKIKGFDKKYSVVLESIQGFRKNMEEQDTVMREIVAFVKQQKNTKELDTVTQTYQQIATTSEAQLDRLTETIQTSTPQLSLTTTVEMPSNTTLVPVINASAPINRKRKRMQPGWSVPPRVLLVDDDSIFRRLSTRLLQIAGCTIDVAVDGMEAVKKLGTGKYDLVLMDIMMPKLDGMSATRNIRQYDTWTPIISMTSNTTDQAIQQYFMSGMTDVLPKPFNQGSLGSLLERYCAHLVVQRQHQQQLHLLQQNYSLNSTLLDPNAMTPQLTLIEDNEEEDKKTNNNNNNDNNNNNNNGLAYLPPSYEGGSTQQVSLSQQEQGMYSPLNNLIPQLQQATSLLPEQQQEWYLYQKRPRME
ncbi:uncharacterized protein B0P05DRAFT_535490 [Gilbertella persicaria]|uniref:uncharacterized protein n=1 Tax=Gilbertella persicaria TaxID=101096 RepID=UPI002220CE89|nr:uncharacterized protein B0P05DRAFT_535490 [Gilbertella persicaria]KAI8084418.1 hypothetical protein B0P05DRAFT_535490 [Gilbertella persicaria]